MKVRLSSSTKQNSVKSVFVQIMAIGKMPKNGQEK